MSSYRFTADTHCTTGNNGYLSMTTVLRRQFTEQSDGELIGFVNKSTILISGIVICPDFKAPLMLYRILETKFGKFKKP